VPVGRFGDTRQHGANQYGIDFCGNLSRPGASQQMGQARGDSEKRPLQGIALRHRIEVKHLVRRCIPVDVVIVGVLIEAIEAQILTLHRPDAAENVQRNPAVGQFLDDNVVGSGRGLQMGPLRLRDLRGQHAVFDADPYRSGREKRSVRLDRRDRHLVVARDVIAHRLSPARLQNREVSLAGIPSRSPP